MKIQIKNGDDWTSVFKDGELVWANHSCSLRDGLGALGIEYEVLWLEDVELPDDDPDGIDWLETAP